MFFGGPTTPFDNLQPIFVDFTQPHDSSPQIVLMPLTFHHPAPIGSYQFFFANLGSTSDGGDLADPSSAVVVIPPDPGAYSPILDAQTGPAGLGISWKGPFYLQAAADLGGPWITLPSAMSPYWVPTSGAEGFYRVTVNVPTGAIRGQVGAESGTVVQVGAGGPIAITESGGKVDLPQVPAGKFELNVFGRMLVVNPATGEIETYVDAMPWEMDVAPGAVAAVEITRIDFTKKIDRPPCGCTPWCGILGGTVNGEQRVVAFGGKHGKCDEIPQVTITAPDGTRTVNPAKRQIFPRAADGVWTITSTVCGHTSTCSITLP